MEDSFQQQHQQDAIEDGTSTSTSPSTEAVSAIPTLLKALTNTYKTMRGEDLLCNTSTTTTNTNNNNTRIKQEDEEEECEIINLLRSDESEEVIVINPLCNKWESEEQDANEANKQQIKLQCKKNEESREEEVEQEFSWNCVTVQRNPLHHSLVNQLEEVATNDQEGYQTVNEIGLHLLQKLEQKKKPRAEIYLEPNENMLDNEFINPLYTTDEVSLLLPNGFNLTDTLNLIFEMKQELGVKYKNVVLPGYSNSFKFCLTGVELMNWCMNRKKYVNEIGVSDSVGIGSIQCNAFYSREDAACFIQQLIDRNYMIIVPYYCDSKFDENNSNQLYRFIDDEDPSFYKDVLNIRPKQQYSYSNSRDSASDFDFTTIISFYQSEIPLKLIVSFFEDIASQIFKFVNYQEKYVDYQAITDSDAFKILTKFSPNLRLVDFSLLNEEERKPFFINLFNLMAIHALIVRGCGNTEVARNQFIYTDFYFLGSYKICLADIMFGILGLQKPPSYKQYLTKFYCSKFDPRIYFFLSNGRADCPLPKAITSIDCEQLLEYNTKQFISSDVEINESEREVTISPIFLMYREDFGSTTIGILNYIMKYLNFEQKKTILAWLKSIEITEKNLEQISQLPYYEQPTINFTLKFREFDYNSQRKKPKPKPKKEDQLKVEEVEEEEEKRPGLEDVKRDSKMRKYFYNFCKLEWSSENVEFYEAVIKYRSLVLTNQMLDYLNEVYEEFLSLSAPREINVTRNLVKSIEDVLNSSSAETLKLITPNLLDDLMKEVDIVLADSFSRFEVSEFYNEMIESQRYSRRKTRKGTKYSLAKRKSVSADSSLSESTTGKRGTFFGLGSMHTDDTKDLIHNLRNAFRNNNLDDGTPKEKATSKRPLTSTTTTTTTKILIEVEKTEQKENMEDNFFRIDKNNPELSPSQQQTITPSKSQEQQQESISYESQKPKTVTTENTKSFEYKSAQTEDTSNSTKKVEIETPKSNIDNTTVTKSNEERQIFSTSPIMTSVNSSSSSGVSSPTKSLALNPFREKIPALNLTKTNDTGSNSDSARSNSNSDSARSSSSERKGSSLSSRIKDLMTKFEGNPIEKDNSVKSKSFKLEREKEMQILLQNKRKEVN